MTFVYGPGDLRVYAYHTRALSYPQAWYVYFEGLETLPMLTGQNPKGLHTFDNVMVRFSPDATRIEWMIKIA